MNLYKFLASNRVARYIKPAFIIGDVIILCIAYLSSAYIRYGSTNVLLNKDNKTIFLLSLLLWGLLASYMETYKFFRAEKIYITVSKIIKVVFIHLSIIALLIVVLNYDDVSRLRMLYFYIAKCQHPATFNQYKNRDEKQSINVLIFHLDVI